VIRRALASVAPPVHYSLDGLDASLETWMAAIERARFTAG
jgi:hypothetical protein